jgi:hypothetical protein
MIMIAAGRKFHRSAIDPPNTDKMPFPHITMRMRLHQMLSTSC